MRQGTRLTMIGEALLKERRRILKLLRTEWLRQMKLQKKIFNQDPIISHSGLKHQFAADVLSAMIDRIKGKR